MSDYTYELALKEFAKIELKAVSVGELVTPKLESLLRAGDMNGYDSCQGFYSMPLLATLEHYYSFSLKNDVWTEHAELYFIEFQGVPDQSLFDFEILTNDGLSYEKRKSLGRYFIGTDKYAALDAFGKVMQAMMFLQEGVAKDFN